MNQPIGSVRVGEPATAGLRILMQNRPNAMTQRGGDTVLMEQTAEGLRALGVSVTIDLNGTEDPKRYDLVHLFNFATPQVTRAYAQRAHASGVPFVVTTLFEDVEKFHTRSQAAARSLVEYVKRGQSRDWWSTQRGSWNDATPSGTFDAAWLVQNAAALFTNGATESANVRRAYGGAGRIIEVPVGHEVSAGGSADLFVRTHGVRDFVFCVGRLESRKNQLMLLKALEDEAIPVVIASGGFTYQPDYSEAVRAFKRRGTTLVLDRLSPEMLASAYQAARIHALPSWYELPGLVSLEAAHWGKNVVATEAGTAADYFGESAFYCDPSNERSVRNAVLAAYYAPAAPELQAIAGRYTWQRAAQTTLEAYRETLKACGRVAESVMAAQPVAPRPLVVTAPPAPQLPAASAAEIEKLLAEGEEAGQNGDLDRAHQVLAKVESMDPKSVRCLRARGAIYLSQGEVSKATDYFARSYSIDPRDVRTVTGLGMCRLVANEIDRAYAHFVQALDIQPDQLIAIRQLIECSYRLGRFEDLERALRKYNELHPGDLEMQFCLAGCLYKRGDLQAAEAIGTKILGAAPTHEGARQLIEIVREEVAKRAVAAPPPAAPSRRVEVPPQPSFSAGEQVDNIILDLEEKKWRKDFANTCEGCEQLLKRTDLSQAHRERITVLKAECLALQNRAGEAQGLYESVLAANPKNSRALCGKGTLLAHGGDWAGAEKLFAMVQELDAKQDIAWAGLALCCLQRGDQEGAWNHFKRAVEINPENTRAILGLIELGYPLRRLSEVEQALKGYLDIHPLDLSFLYSLAGCYFAQNKLQEAKLEVEKITLFEPENRNALELQAMIASKLGHGEVARFR